MDLSNILTISGKSGLFKLVSRSKTGLLVESLCDGKKFPVFINNKVSALEDISILCTDEDIPLKKVFQAIFEEYNKVEVDNISALSAKEITALFAKMVPNYDEDKVYNSDMKKVFVWYNILVQNNLVDLTEDTKVEELVEEEK